MNTEDEDLLISLAIDRRAGPAEWDGLEAIERTDPLVWKRLAAGLREDSLLSLALHERLEAAERVELPPLGTRRGWGVWSGWAAALLLALSWAAWPDRPLPAQRHVLGELPSRLLDSQPAASGRGFDVLFVRQTVERTTVNDLYSLGQTEDGRLSPVPMYAAMLTPADYRQF